MMEKKKKVFEFENIINYFKTKKQGEQVTYDELQSFTHYNLQEPLEFFHFKNNTMRRAKEGLVDYGFIIKAIPEVGYYILKSNQIQSYTYRTYIKRPLKQLDKAKRILTNTNVDLLKYDELQKHELTMQLNSDLIKENSKILGLDKYKELE